MNPHGDHEENTCRIYTKGNEEEIKTCHYKKKKKKINETQRQAVREEMRSKTDIRHTEDK